MKLSVLYKNKYCPHRPPYVCDGHKCAKFASCMMEEIEVIQHQETRDNLINELLEEIGCKQ